MRCENKCIGSRKHCRLLSSLACRPPSKVASPCSACFVGQHRSCWSARSRAAGGPSAVRPKPRGAERCRASRQTISKRLVAAGLVGAGSPRRRSGRADARRPQQPARVGPARKGRRITFGKLKALDAAAAVAFARDRAPGERVGALGISLGSAAALLRPAPLDVDALCWSRFTPTWGSGSSGTETAFQLSSSMMVGSRSGRSSTLTRL